MDYHCALHATRRKRAELISGLQDANLSPLNDALIYSSIGPVVSFVRTKEGEHLEVSSTTHCPPFAQAHSVASRLCPRMPQTTPSSTLPLAFVVTSV